VITGILSIHDVVVAIVADLVTGVIDFLCRCFLQGGSPVMSVLSKIGGDKQISNGEEKHD